MLTTSVPGLVSPAPVWYSSNYSIPSNFSIPGLQSNVAKTMDLCLTKLTQAGLPVLPPMDDGPWCNATWDTVLCWPATPANTSITLRCPPLKGLDPTKEVIKWCDGSGRWSGKLPGVYENPWGWTNFTACFKIKFEDLKVIENITKQCHWSGRWMGRNETDFPHEHGWTNFTMCFTEEVIYIMNHLSNGSLNIAQDVAKNARKLEFVGLGLSLVSLIVSIFIFSYFRRLRVFRNMLHLHLMIAILMVVIIRLVLYIDLIFTDKLGPQQNPAEGKTINTMVFVCEAMFFLLEYFKTVAFGWMFLEGFYLHNQLVLTVFDSEPRLTPYLFAGYGIPLIHTLIWLMALMWKKDFKVERCLGSYYLEPEFWILDGPRMAELVVNFLFICNVIRVLWTKVRESANTSELERMKKSVKAAFMLIPLLGIPNIMQTIPFSPTKDNIMIFAVWTYCASFTYMYQGLMITIIYCFTNKEVNTVLKAFYSRYRLTHTSTNELRRGSRSIATHYQAKNGTRRKTTISQTENVTTALEGNGSQLSPFTGRSKKGSGDSTTRLMLSVPNEEYVNNNGQSNGFGTANEKTPLKASCDCTDDLPRGTTSNPLFTNGSSQMNVF